MSTARSDRPTPGRAGAPGRERLRALEDAVLDVMSRHSLRLLRATLGVVFIWFGALKVAGTSPVFDLVADTLPFLPATPAVVTLGLVEVAIGVGLITGLAIRLTLLVFFGQMLGTFLAVVVVPGELFAGGNALQLTVLGEFLLKNLVLITAGMALVASVPRRAPGESALTALGRRAR